MMDFKKAILYGALFAIGWMLLQKWQEQPTQPQATPKPAVINQTSSGEFIPTAEKEATSTPSVTGQPTVVEAVKKSPQVQVTTDVLQVNINTQGGAIDLAQLLNYQKELDGKNDPFTLFNNNSKTYYAAKSGLIEAGERSVKVPLYQARQAEYQLDSDQQQLRVPLTLRTADGLVVKKTFVFKRGEYLIDVEYSIHNESANNWSGRVYNQLDRRNPPEAGGSFMQIASYSGAAISDPKNKLYEKISYSNIQKKHLNREIDGGWAAMQEHYFLSAWVPPQQQENLYYSNYSNNQLYTIGMMGAEFTVKPGDTYQTKSQLYVGPELPDVLETIAPGLDKTIDYGILFFISGWLFWLLRYIHQFVGNWGWAIVLLTVLIKLAFYRLSAASYRSMANMRRLSPKLQSLKERYGNDKAKFSQATMELYKKEKINPLGGCLPILVQIPVFIALYWVLLESVELRHAPFMLWIRDLSAHDPWFVLPILMGLSMLIQQKLNPSPPDPMQAKVMMALPVVFTALFLFFPAGLVLYWLVNNVLSILQQWYITRKIESGQAKGGTPRGKLANQKA